MPNSEYKSYLNSKVAILPQDANLASEIAIAKQLQLQLQLQLQQQQLAQLQGFTKDASLYEPERVLKLVQLYDHRKNYLIN